MPAFRTITTALMLVCLAAALAACEEDVTAVLGTEDTFTLYGVLTPASDTQWVRVFPIEPVLEPTRPEPLDAVFTSTDSATGETRVWRDSLFQQPDGSYGHLFWAPFRAEYGHTYRIEVARTDDGRAGRVVARVPPAVTLVAGDPVTSGYVVQPVYVEGQAPNLLKLQATYWVSFVTDVTAAGAPVYTYAEYTFPYATAARRTAAGWTISLNLSSAYDEISADVRKHPAFRPTHGITLLQITLDTIVANREWSPPGGIFDPDVLVQPGLMTNVEQGFGFVGAGYRLQLKWVPPDAAVDDAGFRPL